MHQGWLQVAGLGLDFVGVMLLAFEWLAAYRAQLREEDAGQRGVRELKQLAFAQQAVRDERLAAHMRMVEERARDRIRHEGVEIRRSGQQVRLPVFALAMVLIAAGFLLQILGSWPGGIAALGIAPN
jgi:hypothetical protein